jgi:hypothetical protein
VVEVAEPADPADDVQTAGGFVRHCGRNLSVMSAASTPDVVPARLAAGEYTAAFSRTSFLSKVRSPIRLRARSGWKEYFGASAREKTVFEKWGQCDSPIGLDVADLLIPIRGFES